LYISKLIKKKSIATSGSTNVRTWERPGRVVTVFV